MLDSANTARLDDDFGFEGAFVAPALASVRPFPVGPSAASRLILAELESRETRGRLIATAARLLGNEADAEDCVQEATIQALRHAEQFEGRSAPRSWLFRVVVNACKMRRRAERRARRGGGAIHVSLDELVSGSAVSGPATDPEERLVGEDALAVVGAGLSEVPALDRELFTAHVLDDEPLAQLAERHSLTRQAVKSRLFRVRRRLEERLEAETGLAGSGHALRSA